MSGPSTSADRGPQDPLGTEHHHVDASNPRPDYESATATAAAAVNYGAPPDETLYHHGNYTAAAAATAAELQHRAERQRMQQLQQQHELQNQQLQYQQQHQAHLLQQHHHQMQQHQQHHPAMHTQAHHNPIPHQMVHHAPVAEDFDNGILQLRYCENEIIKTFALKEELIAFVKRLLLADERCKIVINSSKPKAVYFQCERSGTFRTTVKDPTKRQRVAYTKRSKCGYRLVANLYPPEKEKKKNVKKDPESIDSKLNDQFIQDQLNGEMWILRMINPLHNHAPEPVATKKKRSKLLRQLVQKPIHRQATQPNNGYIPEQLIPQAPGLHHPMSHMHHDEAVPDAMMAAMEGQLHALAVDPNIDPNVDPSVQAHDHAHLSRGLYRR